MRRNGNGRQSLVTGQAANGATGKVENGVAGRAAVGAIGKHQQEQEWHGGAGLVAMVRVPVPI